MKTVAIVQARMGSSRLPGKVLMDVAGRPLIAHLLTRVSMARSIDEIMIATSTLAADDAIAAFAGAAGVGVFRGSEDDVLGRYAGAARASGADVIVRMTADCPLLDPGVIDLVVGTLADGRDDLDYVSNVIVRSYPRGLDVEAMFTDTLARLERRARSASSREHVTHYLLREHPDLFSCGSVVDSEDNSDLRWTVDEPDDLALVRRLFDQLGGDVRPYRELLAVVRRDPDLLRMNAHVQQKAGQ